MKSFNHLIAVLLLCFVQFVSADDAPLSALGEFTVSRFVFEGNTIFTAEQLQSLVKSYEQREITAEELQDVRHILTQHYVDAGYINSGAIIPDQYIGANRQVKIQLIEGHLTHIEVSGVSYVSSDYIVRRLDYPSDLVLRHSDLQQRLQLLQQHPLVDLFNAELGPGLQLGAAVLDLQIQQPKRPYQLQLAFNNHRAPSIGAYRAELQATHYSVTGHGDSLQLRLGLTKGLKDYALDYAAPLGFKQIEWIVFANRSDSSVVSAPFNQLDIESDSTSYGVKIKYPWFNRYQNNRYQTLDFHIGVEKRRSRTFLLGRPYSFSSGVDDGLSQLSVLRFSQTWQDRSASQVLSFYSNFSFGLNAWNATINAGDVADGRFFSWQGQFHWIKRLPRLSDSQLSLRIGSQISHDALLPLEKFSLGGVATVRGYRENQFTYDSGWSTSLEWQIPLDYSRFLTEKQQVSAAYGAVYIAPFIDYARGKNTPSDDNPRYLYSAGLGLLWSPSALVNARLYWAKAFKAVAANDDHDLQDSGIHFELTVTY